MTSVPQCQDNGGAGTDGSRGLFIVMEGLEGAGKSTQLAFVRGLLQDAGHRVVVTREPGGTEVGEAIRTLLLTPREDGGIHQDTELLLMFAARAEHLRRLIEPTLAGGGWVLCDRFTDATYAYQGGGRGIDPARIAVLEDWVQGALRPDRVLVLDLAPEVGLARVAARGGHDRFEQESVAFFQRVRAGYRERAAADPTRYRLVDAGGDPAAVQGSLRHALADLMA